MKELLILLMIGISLSIDAFSVSTCIGMCNLSLKKTLNTSMLVGLFHFIMPLLGVFTSYQIKINIAFLKDKWYNIIKIKICQQRQTDKKRNPHS